MTAKKYHPLYDGFFVQIDGLEELSNGAVSFYGINDPMQRRQTIRADWLPHLESLVDINPDWAYAVLQEGDGVNEFVVLGILPLGPQRRAKSLSFKLSQAKRWCVDNKVNCLNDPVFCAYIYKTVELALEHGYNFELLPHFVVEALSRIEPLASNLEEPPTTNNLKTAHLEERAMTAYKLINIHLNA